MTYQNNDYNNITKCRVCGGQELEKVFSLEDQTLTGVFPISTSQKITSGPLSLVMCSSQNGCKLIQLSESYSLEDMYGENYGYRSGLNKSMVAHLKSIVKKIIELNILKKNDLIIDIGSNDSTTLQQYPKNNFNLVGIDPSGSKFIKYYPSDIKLISEFFSKNALHQNNINSKAKVITSIAMFYDLEDPVSFASDVYDSLDDDGVWVFEQSYIYSMIRTNSFDTICHEHLEFYSFKQISWILKKIGFKTVDIEINDTNGGSILIIASKKNSAITPNNDNIAKILKYEETNPIDSDTFVNFRNNINNEKNKFIEFLIESKKNSKKVFGLGASTKGNVLLQYYQIGSDLLPFIGEVNSDKFGKFTPKTCIPIISEKELLDLKPDYLVVLPWHFKDFFVDQEHLKNINLVFPLPNFHIVER